MPYIYEQARARSIQAAHPDLLRHLAQRPPSVPPALRRLDPRVTDVAVNGGRSGEAALLASVDDGRQQYTVPLTVTQQRDRRWS